VRELFWQTGEHLIHRWQLLALAAAVNFIAGAGAATAQTVIVKGAPAGSPTELVVNGTAVASATVGANRLATLVVPEANASKANETDAHVFVDTCGELRRFVLAIGALAPPPAEGPCARQAIQGFFALRRTTSFVVDVSGSTAQLVLTQGRVPSSWLSLDPAAVAREFYSPTGLVLFGGGGLALGGDIDANACGDVTDCTSKTVRRAFSGGVAYWFGQFVAAEVQYISPADATVEGTGPGLRFDSSFDTQLLTMAGLIGGPVGRLKLYGRAGANRHRAILSTTQTVDDSSVVVGDDTITIRGGTQTLELRTRGWGYVFGGGGEGWVSKRVAIYADLNRASLKGTSVDVSRTVFNDAAWLVQAGVRVHVGP
jgi:hypothetical protein